MDEPQLTVSEAFRAMFYYLDSEYRQTRGAELGGLLSGLYWNIWNDEKLDFGAWRDWLAAVERAKREPGGPA